MSGGEIAAVDRVVFPQENDEPAHVCSLPCLGISPAVGTVARAVGNALQAKEPVWIEGPCGAGKRFLVATVHAWAGRSEASLYTLSCCGIGVECVKQGLKPRSSEASTLEAEDSSVADFVDEVQRKLAGCQTWLLHEPGALPGWAQRWVARYVEARLPEILPPGHEPPSVASRRPWIVATSSEPLEVLWSTGRIHPVLYFVFRNRVLRMPPLRERPEDIAVLARRFVDQYRAEHGEGPTRLAPETIARLVVAMWPGNVAQLKAAIYSACASAEGETLLPEHLPSDLVLLPVDVWQRLMGDDYAAGDRHKSPQDATRWESEIDSVASTAGQTFVDANPRILPRLRKVLVEAGWNVTEAARRLGVSRTTLYKWMRRGKITRPR